MNTLALDYLIFVFVASSGVLQMVAAWNGLRGLLFIKNKDRAFLAGLIAIVMSFLWFFSEPRNIPDTAGGLDANGQGAIFAAGAASAIVFTFLFSSLRNLDMWKGNNFQHSQGSWLRVTPGYPGLDVLKETTFMKALLTTVRELWRRFLK